MKNLYIILIAGLLTACGNTETTEQITETSATHTDEIQITNAQFKSEGMELGTLSKHAFDETVRVNGMIDVPPHNKSRITTYMGGYVTKTPLLVGDRVKKGQLLVTLENTEYVELQQEYLQVSEQLDFLKNEYTRQKTLFDEKITSEKNYLKAESTYKSSLAHANGLAKKLEMLNLNPKAVLDGRITTTINIYAPIEGSVTRVNVSNGMFVSASDEIMELVDVDHIHLELSVFEKDIMKIKKGQKITFTIPEASDKVYTADVHLVGTTIDETSRRVKVHGHLNNEETNFIVGMFVEADIHLNQATAWALPEEAVIESGNQNYILVLDKQTQDGYIFHKKEVAIGRQTENYLQILHPEKLTKSNIIIKGTSMLLNEAEGGHSH